jgi:predicted acylesterase/phospholipase RssA
MVYKHFSSIVIAGGANKVLAVIGIIRFLEEHDMLKHLINLVGTSAGAILCAFIALKYTTEEIIDFFKVNMCEDDEIRRLSSADIFNVLSTYGLFSGDNLNIFIKRIIIKKLGPQHEHITFIDFAKLTGKNMVVCVSNLTKERAEYWSVDTTPNKPIALALRASCSIPILFKPVVVDQEYYIDGALYDNFPVNYFSEAKLSRDILAVNIKSKGYQACDNFLNYVKFLVASVHNKLTTQTIEDDIHQNTINLEFDDETWFHLFDASITIPISKVREYSNIGYGAIKEKMKHMYLTFSK